MSMQEAALYGDLVLHLRERVAEMLVAAKASDNLEKAGEQLDTIIRDWFFTPQDELYGSSPRDVIWREQLNLGNPIPPQYAHKAFDPDCGCPICQQAFAEIEAGEDIPHGGYYHGGGWNWSYGPESTLIDRYDPEGSEDRWLQERVRFQPQHDPDDSPVDLPAYAPPAIDDLAVSPEEFLEQLNRRQWEDKRFQPIVERLIDRFDCPTGRGLITPEYRRLSQKECLNLVIGLEEQGVELDELVKQVEAWPYQNIPIDWLSEPERHLYFITHSMETRLDLANKTELVRFRQHRDLLFTFCQVLPYNARVWLEGWLEGLMLGETTET